jgi:hypothetical protein
MVDLETMIKGGNTTLDLSAGQQCGYYIQLGTSGHVWTDRRQRRDTSSLEWSTVQLLRCNGKSAGAGGLIDGDKTMLCLGMIDGGDTTLLIACAGGLINSRVTMLLLLAD